MTQGAVKTPGKRSQAVSAKKQAILSAALERFRSLASTARGWSRWQSRPGCQKPICSITTRPKRRFMLR
jgi:hypothetical protein